MARLTTAQKVDRVMRFLLALRRWNVASLLGTHGFGPGDIDEVFGLLRAMTVTDVAGAGTVFVPDQQERVVAWVRHWRPILEPALRRRHPTIAAKFFDFAATGEADADAVAKLFFTHLDELRAREDSEAKAALALIAKKGVDDAVLAELRAATNEGTARKGWPGTDFKDAEKRLWDWYIEWSAVVRARIPDKRLRRELGISESRDDEEGA